MAAGAYVHNMLELLGERLPVAADLYRRADGVESPTGGRVVVRGDALVSLVGTPSDTTSDLLAEGRMDGILLDRARREEVVAAIAGAGPT
ncbi:MAG: hypothetical protein ACRDMH_13135 [Solirubrobacterales bacterium]